MAERARGSHPGREIGAGDEGSGASSSPQESSSITPREEIAQPAAGDSDESRISERIERGRRSSEIWLALTAGTEALSRAVAYRALRVGGAVELRPMDTLAVFAEGAYLNVTQSGQIASEFFPGASAAGMEATFGVRYSVSPSIDLQASGVFTRYVLTFCPEPDALYLADGAIDRYAGGALHLRYRM